MKTKIFALLLSLILCLGILCACGEPENTNGENTNTETPENGEGNTNTETPENGGEVTPPSEEEKEPEYVIGTAVGEKLPSYEVETFDENGLSGKFIDPTSLGRVTVINFWGTWCPPCVNELPEFSEVATEYKDKATIIAIHSVDYFSTNAVAHIKNNFSDSDIIFAKDENTGEGNYYYDECYETFGCEMYYPFTIIINENGIITYTNSGALSKAKLISEIEKALNS